jgi:phosphomannomutase
MKILPIAMSSISAVKPLKETKEPVTKPEFKTETTVPATNLSFTGYNLQKKLINVTLSKAKEVSKSLSTSTSGHRAPYGSENFNKDIVALFTLGVASYVLDHSPFEEKNPRVLIGGDTRKATTECLPLINDILTKQGIDVLYIKDPVPTPLHAMAARDYKVDLGILMTASHNPWTDGGYNLVTNNGAIAPADVTQKVAKYVNEHAEKGFYYENMTPIGTSHELYPYELYKNRLNSYNLIDWEKIKNSGLEVCYDGLQGTGSYVLPKLLEEYGIPFKEVKSNGQEGPNPTSGNLLLLSDKVAKLPAKLKIAISNDGDADRFGILDEKGNFINANDVILLTAYHLAKNHGKRGAIIRSQATSMQIDAIANMYGLKKIETPVGFKFIGEDIIDLRNKGEDILVAGEESGGLTINGHIPEKDGIIALLTIMDLVATENKPISKILTNVKMELPKCIVPDNYSVKLLNDKDKEKLMEKAQDLFDNAQKGYNKFGEKHYIDAEKSLLHRKNMEHYKPGGDGIKLFLNDGSSVLIRKSGTEPLVKFYIESVGRSPVEAQKNKTILHELMNKIFKV